VSRGQRNESPRPLISVFYTGAATFLSSSSSVIFTRLSGPPFQTHYFSDNLVAPGIQPGTSGSVTTNSDHKTTEAVGNLVIVNYEDFIRLEIQDR
jgi:hypothetical protein